MMNTDIAYEVRFKGMDFALGVFSVTPDDVAVLYRRLDSSTYSFIHYPKEDPKRFSRDTTPATFPLLEFNYLDLMEILEVIARGNYTLTDSGVATTTSMLALPPSLMQAPDDTLLFFAERKALEDVIVEVDSNPLIKGVRDWPAVIHYRPHTEEEMRALIKCHNSHSGIMRSPGPYNLIIPIARSYDFGFILTDEHGFAVRVGIAKR